MPFLDLPSETRDVLLETQDATSVHESRAVFLHRLGSDLAQSTNSFAHITSAPSLAWRDSWDLHCRHARSCSNILPYIQLEVDL